MTIPTIFSKTTQEKLRDLVRRHNANATQPDKYFTFDGRVDEFVRQVLRLADGPSEYGSER